MILLIYEILFIWSFFVPVYKLKLLYFNINIPIIIFILLVIWSLILFMSLWRRFSNGFFTRGDRNLIYKNFFSFWALEMSTILGLIIAAAFMSWGPEPFVFRFFFYSKKNFFIELLFLIFLVNILYFGLKLIYLRKLTQCFLIYVFGLLLLIYLMWRDFQIMYFGSIAKYDYNVMWKTINLNIIVFSISHFDWYLSIHVQPEGSILNKLIYFEYINLSLTQQSELIHYANSFEKQKISYNLFYILDNLYEDVLSEIYFFNLYPRRIGFWSKRYAYFFFFIIVKIWHHLFLCTWWFIKLLRLKNHSKIHYTLINITLFNLYMSFLLNLMLYVYQYFYKLEKFFKIKFYITYSNFSLNLFYDIYNYIIYILI